jgi:hypothetical protein
MRMMDTRFSLIQIGWPQLRLLKRAIERSSHGSTARRNFDAVP